MLIRNLLPLVLVWCFPSGAEATSLIGAEVPPLRYASSQPPRTWANG